MLKVATGTLLKASRPQRVSLPIKTFTRSLITLKDHKVSHITWNERNFLEIDASLCSILHMQLLKAKGATGR